MSNSAIIRVGGDSKQRCLYLHYNGGRGSIAALLQETKLRMGREVIAQHMPIEDPENNDVVNEFYATFFGVAREFFGYCTSFKDRTATAAKIKSVDGTNILTDNGCYIINNDFSCDRIDLDALDDPIEITDHQDDDDCQYEDDYYKKYEENYYNLMTDFFNKEHAALCTIETGEEVTFSHPLLPQAQLEQALADAAVITKNAQLREARLAKNLGRTSNVLTGLQVAAIVEAADK